MKKQFIVWVTLMVAMTIGIVVMIMNYGGSGSNLSGLPVLTVTGYEGQYKSFRIYMANEGYEFVSSNPYYETKGFLTLPVYRNPAVTENAVGQSETTELINCGEDNPEEILTPVLGNTFEEAMAIGEELKAVYGEKLGMQNPMIDIYGGTYNVEQERLFYVALYEGSEDITEELVNYCLNRAEFMTDEAGEMHIERKNLLSGLEKVGDYPLVSVDEARKLLQNGNYITTSLFGVAAEEYVAEAELVYKADGYEEFVMPFYCFYVEMPQLPGNGGMKTYATYYVPAVEKKYISNMPKWTGELK